MTTFPIPKEHIAHIKPYKQGKTSRAEGVTPIKLSSNENPYGASPKAIEAYINAAHHIHRYPDGSCYDIRHALAAHSGAHADAILCGAGSDELISLLIAAYAGQGDEVLFTRHAFLMYKIYTISHGATPVEVPEKDLHTDVDALLEGVSERTKIVFVANPNNPTGTYVPLSDIKRLRDGLPSHVILALDGAYAECADATDYDAGLGLVQATHNTVMLRTFSKLYGLPSLRLGWMVAHENIIDAVGRVKSPFNVTGPAQAAAVAALEDYDYMREQQQLNAQQRMWLGEQLNALGLTVTPSQCNFLLVDCHDRSKAQRILDGLEAQHIYIRDVLSYKLPHHVRISIGTTKENQRLIEALEPLI